ncbi:MAG TPA: malto-oligosyltrehalose trehalohydrolase [Opitutaceae bacterium]|jgi:maltooligosyltrehalose trehalohydrolase
MPTDAETGVRTVGANVSPLGVSYRVWAPGHRSVAVELGEGKGSRSLAMHAEGENGYWSTMDEDGAAGDLYKFRIDEGACTPDVASRFQPLGVEGPSECIDPSSYGWRSGAWCRPGWRGQVTYELHVGAFTAEGTFRAAVSKLPHLRSLGVEAIELMPVADFNGARNWGYDGVALFAPARCYGRPDDLRALVDEAHLAGMAVILDVVYNHVGPSGSYLERYSKGYLAKSSGAWGSGYNLDGPDSGPVREFLLGNAAYWLDEFRMDGLRLDATHAISDSSPNQLIQQIAEVARARGAFTIAEDARNLCALAQPEKDGGLGIDAVWADDFHHQVRVCMTGTRDGYYSAFSGQPADIADTIANGWFYRGQGYGPWRGTPRGSPCSHLAPERFVYCIENHDQVGNRANGERLENLVSREQFRAASVLLCLAPHPPLIFMGQEWAASAPFLFFTDHGGELGRMVSEGRRKEHGHGQEGVPDPERPDTFDRSKLDWDEADAADHAGVLRLYKAALQIRGVLGRRGALERPAWSISAKSGLLLLSYTTPDFAMLLAAALGPRVGGQVGTRPSPFGEWSVVLNSNWRKFGGAMPDGTEILNLEGAGTIVLVAGRPAVEIWPSS